MLENYYMPDKEISGRDCLKNSSNSRYIYMLLC